MSERIVKEMLKILINTERIEDKIDKVMETLKKALIKIGTPISEIKAEKPKATTEKPLVEEEVDNATLFVKEVEDYSAKSLKLTSQSGQSAYMAKSMVESWDIDKITILKGKEWVLKKIEWK